MRMVVGPVSANFTGTLSPTVRWSELAVVGVDEQVAGGQRPAELPAVMFRITVCGEVLRPEAEDGLE